MKWPELRRKYPHQWLLAEAIQAHSEAGQRHLDELAVVEAFEDGESALRSYLALHRRSPGRELYVLHTDRERLEVAERSWLGLRRTG